jgi:ribose 5-phosphate isomerase B
LKRLALRRRKIRVPIVVDRDGISGVVLGLLISLRATQRHADHTTRATLRTMRVYLGSDHAGFELKNHLVEWLTTHGHEPVDCGPYVYDAQDDYPPFCLRTAERTAADEGSLGVVIGGSGNGEQIAANKVKGVRAALAWSEATAELGREHNNANVVAIGSRMHTTDEATSFVEVFIKTPYSGAERHARRIAMLDTYVTSGELPPIPAHHPKSPQG